MANLVLINRRKNSKLGRLDFKDKKMQYFKTKQDVFKTNRVFEMLESWTPAYLQKRQEFLVNLLTKNEPCTLEEYYRHTDA